MIKIVLALVAAGTTLNAGASQGHQTTPIATPEQQGITYMTADPRISFSVIEKPFCRMGDSAVVAIKNVIGSKPVTAKQADRIVNMLSMAFEAPRAITNPTDRKPVAALPFLKSIEPATLRAETRDRLIALKQRLAAIQ